jgi:hypothetical protein
LLLKKHFTQEKKELSHMYSSGWANAVISRVIFNVNIIIVSFLSRVSAAAATTTRIKKVLYEGEEECVRKGRHY